MAAFRCGLTHSPVICLLLDFLVFLPRIQYPLHQTTLLEELGGMTQVKSQEGRDCKRSREECKGLLTEATLLAHSECTKPHVCAGVCETVLEDAFIKKRFCKAKLQYHSFRAIKTYRPPHVYETRPFDPRSLMSGEKPKFHPE